MSQKTITEPSGDEPGLPIRTLRVDVLDGPDAGASLVAESDVVSVGTAQGNDLVLSDPTVSRYHLELVCRSDGALVVDHGSTNGTLCGVARIERAVVPAGATLVVGRTTLRIDEGERATAVLHAGESFAGLVGRTPQMRRLMGRGGGGAETDASVLIVGESGTGKELVARALHEAGPRAKGPFETVDCGALSAELVASELFGHERGAFTGADRQHVGAFERANGGTLFLDEIGELSASLQPALLGALERQRFRRVGGRADIEVDVRVVSATNRDLRAEVNAGTFRLDLYYRLAVVVLRLPPLRERAEDVPLLVEHFLSAAEAAGRRDELFPPGIMTALAAHRWPGNVRELRNLVDAAVAMNEMPSLEPGSAAPASETREPATLSAADLAIPYGEARARVLRAFERRYLEALLARTSGNVSRAAREAQMDRSHLGELLKRHALK